MDVSTADRRSDAPSSQRRSLRSEQAYTFVKARLLDGQFRPGEYLPIDQLARDLDLSRQPVMEAMRLLAGDELVEIVPQVGCRVRVPTRAEIGDFYQLFSRMEGLAAELTADRHETSELRRLRLVSREVAELKVSKEGPLERARSYRLLNREFHGLIHSIARFPSLERLATSLWDRGDFYVYAVSGTGLAGEVDGLEAEHEAIVSAIADRDGAEARALMEAHLLGFGRRLLARASDILKF